jgi:hypothetical protein
MNSAIRAVRGVLGLFFDDGSLALVILGLLVVTSLLRPAGLIGEPAAMAILVAGTVIALIENVVRTALASGGKD